MPELTIERLESLRDEFSNDPKIKLGQNLSTSIQPEDACFVRSVYQDTNHVFNNKVGEDCKPVSNQKSSGRCWLFACLNAVRVPFIKQLELDEFEFSQAYLFYWDKIERSNHFLHTILEVARRPTGETVEGRLMSSLLSSIVEDGGQWDMVANLIKKHGLMPKSCFPETTSCENSRKMNRLLRMKLCEYAHDLLNKVKKGLTDEEIHKDIADYMKVIYRIVGISLSVPPKTFVWEYYDKSKNYKKIGPVSPLEFYNEHVKPHFDVEDYVCFVSDPRKENPVNRSYTVDSLGNVVGGQPVVYNNQPMSVLLDLSAKSLQAKVPVWFGSTTSHQFSVGNGIMDLDAFDHELIFGTNLSTALDKGERLRYGVSFMAHAMVLTAVHMEDGVPTRWRIENSWGSDRCKNGYISMTSGWFEEFAFEVVIKKEFVPKELLDVFDQTPIVLPAWDPMGILAGNNCEHDH